VGYIGHVLKAVGKSPVAGLEVSDACNDLLQRCMAMCLRALTHASEEGPGGGARLGVSGLAHRGTRC